MNIILKRVRFFGIIQDWILKLKNEESTLRYDFSVSLMHHDPGDLELICLIKRSPLWSNIYL